MIRWLIPLVLLCAAACAPGAGSSASVPTLTLIPPTSTFIPTAIPATATSANLPAPQDVISPTITPAPADSSAGLTGQALVEQDPVAESLMGVAKSLVSKQVGLPTSLVSLVDARTVVWTDSTLDCPSAGSQPVPTQTDGYRFVLRAANKDFLFHTDVDRVIPCDPADEHMPAGVVVPTEAATAEITPETTSTSSSP